MTVQIDQAFSNATLNGGLALDIVHENGIWSYWNGATYDSKKGIYTPNTDRGYVELRMFPAGIDAFSLANSDEHVGFAQFAIRFPLDVGSIAMKQKVDALMALFVIGNSISYSGQNVFIVSKRRDSGIEENGFYKIIVRVNYRAFVNR